MKEMTDRELVVLAQQGSVDGFTELAARYYPALLAIAQSVLGDKHLAEDAAQESLLAAYRGIARLKQPERFAGWLTAICRNIALDMARARVREKHAGVEDCSPVSNPSRHEDDVVATVREIILNLEPDMREVIYLKYYGRMDYGRIAQMLGVSEEAVNGRLRRARDTVRRQLQRRASMETEP